MKSEKVVGGVFEVSQKLVTSSSVEKLALFPPRTAKIVFLYAKRVVANSAELFFPSKIQKDFARELAGEHALEKVSEVVEEIEVGQQLGNSEIIFSGRAALAEKVIEAGEAETVPWAVTDKIIDIALEAEVDPTFEPYLDDGPQNKLKKVLQKHDVVQDIFRNK